MSRLKRNHHQNYATIFAQIDGSLCIFVFVFWFAFLCQGLFLFWFCVVWSCFLYKNTYVKFDYLDLSFQSSFLVDDKGKHLSAHTKEAIWQRIQPFINQQHVHNQGTVLHGETRLRLIIKRTLILKHRITHHQEFPSSRYPSRFLTSPTCQATIRTANPSIILTDMC